MLVMAGRRFAASATRAPSANSHTRFWVTKYASFLLVIVEKTAIPKLSVAALRTTRVSTVRAFFRSRRRQPKGGDVSTMGQTM